MAENVNDVKVAEEVRSMLARADALAPAHRWRTLRRPLGVRVAIRYGCEVCGLSGSVRDVERRFGRCHPNPTRVGALEFQP